MGYIGIIGGSNFLKSEYFLSGTFKVQTVSTDYGLVKSYVSEADQVIFIQRHAANPEVPYSPPHLINKKAILSALKNFGVERILAFNSTGSMRPEITLGTVVVPNDFLCHDPITFFDDGRAHLIPGFNEQFRQEIIEELKANGFSPLTEVSHSVIYKKQVYSFILFHIFSHSLMTLNFIHPFISLTDSP